MKKIAAMLAALFAAGTAMAAEDSMKAIPANLQVPAGQSLVSEVPAIGVQVYTCSPTKADAQKFEWAFKGPEADLFDTRGRKIGIHYGGPSWESADGSKAVAALQARDDGPNADAIPWLLLSARSASGTGEFGRTQFIQRVYTVGGKAPAAGCDKSAAGTEARVFYKATYYFYAPKL
jgi:hypothetical protein